MSTSVAGSFGVCMEIINNYHTLYIWGVCLRLFILIISLCAKEGFFMSKKQLISAENVKVSFGEQDVLDLCIQQTAEQEWSEGAATLLNWKHKFSEKKKAKRYAF